MSEERNQTISALIDGELPRARRTRTIDEVIGDPASRALWSRYHLVGDVLRKTPPVVDGGALAARVRAALDAEPRLLAGRRRGARGLLAPAAGLAIAASVAVVAVLSLRGFVAGPADPAPVLAGPGESASGAVAAGAGALDPQRMRTAAIFADGGAAEGAAEGADAGAGRGVAAGRGQWNDAGPGVERRLNAYLVNHSEYLGNGTRGMLPYARIVGYDTRE